MKILVTGCAGFIGSHVSEVLVSAGHQVVGLDSVTDYYNPAKKELNIKSITEKGVNFIKKDLVTDDISDAALDAEVVFHFAAQPGISSSVSFDLYERNNFLATHKLLEAVKNNSNLKLFVNISTSSVYGLHAVGDEDSAPRPASHYGVTKLAAEQLALSYFYSGKLPVVSFRPFSVYGERERPEKLFPKLISAILQDKPFTLYEGSLEHIRSYTYVGDIVNGLLLALPNIDACVGQIFNLGTDQTITTGEVVSIVENIIGKKATMDVIPKRSGDQMETSANIGKIGKILGYKPEFSPEEGLPREIEWVKKVLAAGLKI
jgi:nucleoside-diphosphate-sugar epimerase